MSLVLQDQLALVGGGGGDVSNKVDKITDPSKVYATTDTGAQTGITYSTTADANTVVERNANAQVNVNLTPTENNNATSKKYVDDRVTAAIAEAVVFKGIVADETALPSSGNVNGDMYWITAFSSNPPTGMTAGNSGSAIYKGNPDNKFFYTEDAIYQPDEQTIDFNGNGKLAVQVSATTGNTLTSQNDGLYVPTVDLSGKVDKTNTANQVYVTDGNSTQTTVGYTTTDKQSTIVVRDTNKQINIALTPTADSNATSKKYVDDADSGKVDKVSSASKVYGTDSSSNQTTYDISTSVAANTIAYRGSGGRLAVGTPTTDVNATTKKYVDDADALKQNKSTITTPSYAELTVPLEDNKIVNCTRSEGVQILTISNPSTVDVDFSCEINFTSGNTPTVINASNIVWLGDNVNENTGFVPRANCRYTVDFTYDGSNIRGYVQGVSL